MRNSEAIDTLAKVQQRADLTFKSNAHNARHGWLRLTPAYSVKLVESILRAEKSHLKVLDPFSGTATTPLCASYRGHHAVSLDINPFLVWFGQAKLRHYSENVLWKVREAANEIQSAIENGSSHACTPPPIANLERWWDKKRLDLICSIKGEIDHYFPDSSEVKDLLLIAFCRCVIDLSNAAFNHQSMSFKDKKEIQEKKQLSLWPESYIEDPDFRSYVDPVIESASRNPGGEGHVLKHDARSMDDLSETGYDILLTSPPYPNRMSYIRELRPYMYWLGYLKEAREAGELDWQAIGGTWGVATSRLNDWRPGPLTYYPDDLEGILNEISRSDRKSGELLSKYVGKYFEDMWLHFKTAKSVMKKGSKLHYIIGNSKFYEVMVPAERIYSEMLKEAGFNKVEINVLRKRNSKKELFEFDVTAAY